ncbi:MAG TPA: PAS domain-containing protein, partial [Ideonella sp.]|nr:PAS domain-containing protein [Ideonella sp.]
HGRPLRELVDTGTFYCARAHVAELEQGESAPREYALRHKNGSKKLVQVSAAADVDRQGRPVGYVLSSADGRERAARADLSAAQQRLSLALEVSEAGFWSWDLNTQAEHYSTAFKALMGYAEADFPAQFAFFGAIHPDDSEATLDALAAAIQDGARFDREFRLRCADGAWRWMRGIGHAVREPASPLALRFEGVARDISGRKLAQLELEQAQALVMAALERCAALAKDLDRRRRFDRVRGELVAAANHALRTPLASIIGALELLQDDTLPMSDDAPESLLAMALENAGRLAVVIEQWLDAERIDVAGARCAPLELDAMVAGLIEHLARSRRVRVDFESTAPALVSADPAKLRQALSYLLGGAMDRARAGTTLTVRLALRQGRAVLTIEDPAAHATMGDLALAIAKAIVERMDGTLRLERGPVNGALLALELPCVQEPVHA